MKKVLIFILILGLLFALTGCSSKKILDNGQTVETIANFYVIKKMYPTGFGTYPVRLCYDPDTKAMYYIIGREGSYSFSISPYYLSSGEIGIYGKNYK